jgi:protein-S-isoprenylcysteine O-methyltransferase Ste14
VGSVIRAVYAKRHRQKRLEKLGLDELMMVLASVGLIVLPLVYLFTPWLNVADYPLPPGAGWAGAVVFAAALWLLWRSHVDLGRHWTATLQILEEHSLVTHGAYRRIRHPMYAAHWLWAIAQALLLANWIAGPSLLATMLPMYLVRVPREEQMMLDQFGEQYRSYVSRTGRIIPRFW